MKALEIPFIVAISLFCLLVLFLLTNPNARKKGFGWIGAFFLLLAINFIDGNLLIKGFYLTYPHLAFWEDPFVLLYGPLIYLFSLNVKNGQAPLNAFTMLHFLPFILMEIVVLIFHTSSTEEQIKVLLNQIVTQDLGASTLLVIVPLFAHLIGYVLLAHRILYKHQVSLKQYYSSVEVSWTFSLLKMILIIFSSSLLLSLIQYSTAKQIFPTLLLMLNLVIIVLMSRTLLFALKEPLFQTIAPSETGFKISENELELLNQKIKNLLTKEKMYKDPNLTLKDLAKKLNFSERAISHVINHSIANNFYDLINTYRIQEAAHILSNPSNDDLTILEILYGVGYNSKSSFNTQFKKKKGLTPTEFRKQHNKPS